MEKASPAADSSRRANGEAGRPMATAAAAKGEEGLEATAMKEERERREPHRLPAHNKSIIHKAYLFKRTVSRDFWSRI